MRNKTNNYIAVTLVGGHKLYSMALTWSCYKGVAIVDTPVFRGISNSDGVLEKKTVKNLGWK